MAETVCDPKKLTAELMAANLPVAGVSSAGRVDYTRDLTASEKNLAGQLLAAHDPAPLAADLRCRAYADAGITAEKLVLALWKELKTGDSTEADSLQAAMAAIDRAIQ